MAIWDPIVDAVSGVGSTVKDLVKRAVSAAVDFVSSWVNDIVKWVQGWITWLSDNANRLRTDLSSAAQDVARLIDRAWNAIPALVMSWVDWLRDRIHDARQWASDVSNAVQAWAEAAVNGAYHWVYDNVYAPLLDMSNGIYRWVTSTIVPTVLGWVHDLLAPITTGLHDIREVVADVRRWVDVVANDVLPVLRGAWHFLLFVAAHPLDWWLILARQWLSFDREWWARHLADTRGSIVTAAMSAIERWIG